MSTPVGPYTPVLGAGGWIITSGQIGLGPEGLADGFEAQLRQALENLRGHVEGAGARMDQVVKTTVFLVSMDDYPALNDIYTAFFDDHAAGHRPARSAVAVAALPIGALVEIEAMAFVG
ncbi:MAG: RidA family protein [Microthrixaceae bacterium]|nr:RidA family protein [Microthrixaceae bacterium]